MPFYAQPHVRDFIEEHLTRPGLELNKLDKIKYQANFFADAAKRRGLKITPVGKTIYYYKGNRAVGSLYKMRSSLVSLAANNACDLKDHTTKLFAAAGVPIPVEKSFSSRDLEGALKWFEESGCPAVIKPQAGAAGRGITTGIQTAEQFQIAWQRANEATKNRGAIIVQHHVSGIDIRAFVVGDRVVAASSRIPAFVVGDGESTINKLAEEKQLRRNTNIYLSKTQIPVDEEWLSHSDFRPSSVPAPGEIVFLSGKANIHQGGEHVDITSVMSNDLKEIAVRACQAVPGLGAAGIDILTPSVDSAEGAVVIEANTNANISVHHFPGYGASHDVAGAIMDLMIKRSGVHVPQRRAIAFRRFARRILGEKIVGAIKKFRK